MKRRDPTHVSLLPELFLRGLGIGSTPWIGMALLKDYAQNLGRVSLVGVSPHARPLGPKPRKCDRGRLPAATGLRGSRAAGALWRSLCPACRACRARVPFLPRQGANFGMRIKGLVKRLNPCFSPPLRPALPRPSPVFPARALARKTRFKNGVC